MSRLSANTLYAEARSEVLDHAKRLAATRSWAIAAVGGAAALIAKVVMLEPPKKDAMLSAPSEVTALILIAGVAINLAFWTVSLEHARGVIRMGVYLLFFERDFGHPGGWEHWVWFRYSKKLRKLQAKILGDVMFWLNMAYIAGTVAVHLKIPSGLSLIAVLASAVCLAIGLGLRGYTHFYRGKAFREIAGNWDFKENWFEEVFNTYGEKVSSATTTSATEPKAEADG